MFNTLTEADAYFEGTFRPPIGWADLTDTQKTAHIKGASDMFDGVTWKEAWKPLAARQANDTIKWAFYQLLTYLVEENDYPGFLPRNVAEILDPFTFDDVPENTPAPLKFN